MNNKKIKDLSTLEVIALASAEFKQDRFTGSKLTTWLCFLMNVPFSVGLLNHMDTLLEGALAERLVEMAPGPRGGLGYRISIVGADQVEKVELPGEMFSRRDSLDDERSMVPKENPGPMLQRLLGLPFDEDVKGWRAQQFARKLAEYWLKHGWLSVKQCDSAAEIASQHGVFIKAIDYVGTSPDMWLRPCRESVLRRQAENKAQERKMLEERAHARKEAERIKIEVRDANREVRRALDQLEADGKLDELDALVATVFPGTLLSKSAKSAAYAGAGSKGLRTCIAALAFGKPPSLVWQGRKGIVQPGPDSQTWKELIEHPAYQAFVPGAPITPIQ